METSGYLARAAGAPDFKLMDTSREKRSWVNLVIHDVHFWVPVAVLIAGLLVLRWIS